MSFENRNPNLVSHSSSIDDHDAMVIATINTLEQRLLHLEELSRKSVEQAIEEIEIVEQQQYDAYLSTIIQLEKEIVDRKRKEEYWHKRCLDIESKFLQKRSQENESDDELNHNKCDMMPSSTTTWQAEPLDKPPNTLASVESEQDELSGDKHRNQIPEHDYAEKSSKAALPALQAKMGCMEMTQQNEEKERKSTNHQQSSYMQNEMKKKDKLIVSLRKQIDAYEKYTKDLKSELELTLGILKEQGG